MIASHNNKKMIVVLGMHRSGTSALAGVLGVLGIQVPKTLMPPSTENQAGYWESNEIYRLHEELFSSVAYAWNDYRRFPFEVLSETQTNQFVESMVKILRSEFPGDEIAVLKDPRICILMPIWDKIFKLANVDPLFVILVRNPLEVSASISERNGNPREQSLLLWLRHVLGSEMETRNRLRCFVSYESLLNDWHAVVKKIGTSLNVKFNLTEDSTANVDRFLESKLRHYYFTDKDIELDDRISPWVLHLYRTLIQVSKTAKASISGIFDEIAFEMNRADLLFGSLAESYTEKIEKQQKDIIRMNESIAKYEDDIASLNDVLSARDAQVNVLNQLVKDRHDQLNVLTHALTVRDEKIDALSQAQVNNDLQLSITNKLLSKRDDQIACLELALAELQKQIIDLTEETVRRGEWALGLVSELKNTQAQLQLLYCSKSWRLTLPLREIRYWVTAPVIQSKKYTLAVLRSAKKLYQTLPFTHQTRIAHRMFLGKYFPGVLLGTGTQLYNVRSSIPQKVTKVMEPVSDESLSLVAASLHFPVFQHPHVSVIIPVYGNCNYTIRCLASIHAMLPQVLFEIIVVDDCSPDNSADILQTVTGIRLIRNSKNQGFIRSCNLGAKEAKGIYLCFLNNDTEVSIGWLDELVRTFHEFPGTGLAGSKLVYPDGELQEAGGIIWRDGSVWNFGRYQDPLLPVYNYAREVDYCSGASIMVPNKLFNELGGFDEHYLPAYCEDSDLALKIRDKGYRVIYQPMSTIVHYEGVTSGTDTTQGTKSYQIENSKKLFARWKDSLISHQMPGVDVDNAKDRRATRRVLVLDHCTPTPNQDAGSVTVFNTLLLLREMDFQVTFIPEDNFLYMPEYSTALQRVGVEVLYAPYVTSVEQHLKECGERYDLAFLFRPGVVERHLKTVRKYCHKAKALYHTVDLHFLRMSREAELQSDKIKQKAAGEMKLRELAAIRASDASIVHSTTEFDLLHPELPDAKLYVFPLIMDIKGTNKNFVERRDIVFVGGYQHAPNVDAVQYFVAEVMPLVRKKLPGVRFYAVGSKAPPELRALASDDVIISGFVEDLTSLLNQMRVSVAPLRYGAGIKGKIGTAMAVGLPVVATLLAAEGMSLSDGENILVADGTEEFSNTIVKLYQDEALWNHVSQNGLKFAEHAWGAESAWGILAGIVADLGMDITRGGYRLSLYSEYQASESNHKKETTLYPIASAKSRKEFEQFLQSDSIKQLRSIENKLLNTSNSEAFVVEGFCVPCDKKVFFLVDMQFGGQRYENGWIPNWRERLECPLCRMNNRQRLVATLVKQTLSARQRQKVYFMEQVSLIYSWASVTFKQHQLVGSEYLGHEYKGGSTVKGIRHEDVENLSFVNAHLDLIVSTDVFEHVPDPAKAFAECARVLKPGGILLATIPFLCDSDSSVVRARFNNGQLMHILSPAFHGNPVSAEGSLVFTDFCWDLLEVMKEAGFSDVCVEVYASHEFGHLGGGQLVFKLIK